MEEFKIPPLPSRRGTGLPSCYACLLVFVMFRDSASRCLSFRAVKAPVSILTNASAQTVWQGEPTKTRLCCKIAGKPCRRTGPVDRPHTQSAATHARRIVIIFISWFIFFVFSYFTSTFVFAAAILVNASVVRPCAAPSLCDLCRIICISWDTPQSH